jgi:hypothetical protein
MDASSKFVVEKSDDDFGYDVYEVIDGIRTPVSWQVSERMALLVARGLANGECAVLSNGWVA